MKETKGKPAWKAAALGAVLLAGALGGTAMMVRAGAQTWSGSADTSWFDSTYTTFKIDTPAKLAGIAKLVNEDSGVEGLKGKILEVDQSLDLSAFDWVPIGTETHPFKGTLIAKDGAMFSIAGMRVPSAIPYQGLVGNMEGGTVGGFRFEGDGSIDLSTVSGNVYAGSAVGRMSGYSIVYDIENSIGIEAESLSGTVYAGGIVGSAEGQVANVSNGAAIRTEGSAYAGGLLGYVSSGSLQMKTAHNGGAVTSGGHGVIYAGGIAGYSAGMLTMNDQNTVISSTAPVEVTAGSLVHAGGFSGGFGAPVLFSGQTAASGSVTVRAPQAAEVYAGGLTGSIDGAMPEVTMALPATGAVDVQAGGTVHAGGIAGHVVPMMSWSKGYIQTALIEASGGDVYAGGLFGSAAGGLQLTEASSRAFSSSGEIHVLGGGKVRAGGIVGELGAGMLSQASFKGLLDARAQAMQADVQAGGIVGRAAAGTVIDRAYSGGTPQEPVSITAQGELGGIAGRAEGTIQQSFASNLVLTATVSDSSAGGIAGSASGMIQQAAAGAADAQDSSSMVFKTAIASPSGGRESFTAGGLVGRGMDGLTVTDSRADRLSVDLPAGKKGYVFGGAAGRVEGQAVLGTAAEPVRIAGIALNAQADDAALGGAVGAITGSVQAELLVSGLDIQSGGAMARIGGIVGESFGSLIGAEAEDISITSIGADARLGGAAGLSGGSISSVIARDVAITAGGAGAEAGGLAGRLQGAADSRATLTDSVLEAGEDITVSATAAGARIGGAAGYAVHADIVHSAVRAEAPNYAALAVSAPGIEVGGLAGRAENSLIEGDSKAVNVQNLLLTASAAASETKAGGIVGRSAESTLRGLVGSGASVLLSGPNTQAGGLVGSHKGGELPSISGSLFTGMQLKANASTADSIIGGLAGRLEARAGDPAAQPQSSLGIIANSRVSGSVQGLAPGMTVGGLVGENASHIANVSVTDKLPVTSKGASAIVGGLVGRNTGTGTLYYTYSNANLSIEGQGTLAGGLVGDNAGRILSSYTDLDLTSKAYGTASQPVFLGGLTGRSSGGIEQAYAASRVTASGAYVQAGGLIGELSGGTVKNAYSAKSVTASGTGSYAGGFAGRILSGKVSSSYSAAEVTASGSARAGGFAGRYDNTSKELLYKSYYIKDEKLNLNKDLPDFADGQYRWLSVLGRLSTILSSTLSDRSEFPVLSGWDFATAWKYGSLGAQYQYPEVNRTASSGGGEDGTGGSVNTNVNWYLRDKEAPSYQIGSEAELAGLAAIVNGTLVGIEPFNFEGRMIEIKGPIHVQSAQWSPIGVSEALAFQGELLGGGHLIDGYAVSGSVQHGGLFGVIGVKGSVSGLKLEPKSVHGSQHAGALAGLSYGDIRSVELKLPEQAAVIGGVAGGMLGRNEGVAAGLRVELAGGRVESAGDGGAAGGIAGENISGITSGSWTLTTSGEAASRIAASGGQAAAGGLIGRQTGASEGLQLELTRLVVETSGTGSASGGLVGHYRDGVASQLQAIFGESGAVRAAGAEGAAGGLIGVSDAGNILSGLKATAAASTAGVTGAGSAGGLIGEKAGRGIAAWDVSDASVKGLAVASPAGSQEVSVGGLIGRAHDAALHGLKVEAAALNAKGKRLTAGGVIGYGQNVTIQDAEVSGPISASLDAGSTGSLAAGGIAGVLSSSDRDAGLRFGNLYPLYHGLYQSHYSGKLTLAASGGESKLLAGGLVGQLLQASVYESDSSAAIAAGSAGELSAGGIAGYSSGILVHADAHGGIDASSAGLYRVGGLLGQGEDGEVHYSTVQPESGAVITVGTAVTIGENLPAAYVGGAIGQGDRMAVAHSSASIPVEAADANIDSTLAAGGFAGLLGDGGGNGSGSIRYSYADGAVKASGKRGSYAGGFAGSIERFAIEDSYASGSVSNAGQDTRTGGFAAAVERTGTVQRSYALQSSVATTGLAGTTRSYTGGFAGYNDGMIRGVYAAVGELSSTAQGTDVYKGALVGYNFRDGAILTSTYTGSGAAIGRNAGAAATAEAVAARDPRASGAWRHDVDPSILRLSGSGEIVIGSRERLDGYVLLSNDTGLAYFRLFDRQASASPLGSGDKVRLAADIDLSAFRWTPLQDFDGELDGGGHRISGLAAEGGAGGDAAFTLVNRGRISNLQLVGADVKAARHAGLLAAVNAAGGQISGVTAAGSVSGGESAGLIAGVNEGLISRSGAAGKAQSSLSAGGLAGDNRKGGVIEVSYSEADASAVGADAAAGGAAGLNEGVISDTLATGRITADGRQQAWAGGIAGRSAGVIERSVAGGEPVAAVDGVLLPGRAFFGGLAGRLEAGGEIHGSFFQKGMVKRGVAYYDAAGTISADGALDGAKLTSGTLPAGLSGDLWHAAAGFYPAPADTVLARLASAAAVPAAGDTVNRLSSSFGISQADGLQWSADASLVQLQDGTGRLLTGGSAMLKAELAGYSRSIILNTPELRWPQAAATPRVVSGDKDFKEKVDITLAAEPGAVIHYTLDGSEPSELSAVYAAPITLKATTTLKAIAVVTGKEISPALSGEWKLQKEAGGGGFGGFFPGPTPSPTPEPKSALASNIGKPAIGGEKPVPVRVPRSSILRLTAPEGKWIRYTTDGSDPTENSRRFVGELVLTRSTTIKAIIEGEDVILTYVFEVGNAGYDLRKDASTIRYAAGYADGSFKPNAAMSRYELIEFLAPLLDREAGELHNAFPDRSDRSRELVAFFASAGIVGGYPDGTFGGDRSLTRAEFAVIASRVLKLDADQAAAPKQKDALKHWAAPSIGALTQAGLIQGFPDGSFRPNSLLTRAQAVVLINRLAGTLKQPDAGLRFSDLSSAHWAYKDIMSAVNPAAVSKP